MSIRLSVDFSAEPLQLRREWQEIVQAMKEENLHQEHSTRQGFHLGLTEHAKASSSVPFSRAVVSDSLQPHGLQHTRPLCLSPTPGVYSNSCPLSRWCHPTISSSVIPVSLAFSLSQHQCLFQWVSSSYQAAKVLEFQLRHQSFRTDFLQDGLVGSHCSPRDSQESLQHHSLKPSILWCSAFFIVQLSHSSILLEKP